MEGNETKLEAGLSRLQEEQQKSLHAALQSIEQWRKFEKDYQSLHTFLETVPNKLTHNVMVPFGKLAFAPGKLINTNEVLVLLGDNWFVERSARQAQGVVERRLKSCQDTLNNLEKEKDQSEEWIKHTQFALGEGVKEIIEEYDPTRDTSWKEKRMQGKRPENSISSENSVSQRRTSRVQWQDQASESTTVISFKHSEKSPPSTLEFQDGETPPTLTSPSDIWHLFGSPNVEKKSILKSTKPTETVNNKPAFSELCKDVEFRPQISATEAHSEDDNNQAFTGTIVETDLNTAVKAETEVPKRPMSRFKAQRSKK